jgi:tetratricopeptide (TPR) repeat protein
MSTQTTYRSSVRSAIAALLVLAVGLIGCTSTKYDLTEYQQQLEDLQRRGAEDFAPDAYVSARNSVSNAAQNRTNRLAYENAGYQLQLLGSKLDELVPLRKSQAYSEYSLTRSRLDTLRNNLISEQECVPMKSPLINADALLGKARRKILDMDKNPVVALQAIDAVEEAKQFLGNAERAADSCGLIRTSAENNPMLLEDAETSIAKGDYLEAIAILAAVAHYDPDSEPSQTARQRLEKLPEELLATLESDINGCRVDAATASFDRLDEAVQKQTELAFETVNDRISRSIGTWRQRVEGLEEVCKPSSTTYTTPSNPIRVSLERVVAELIDEGRLDEADRRLREIPQNERRTELEHRLRVEQNLREAKALLNQDLVSEEQVSRAIALLESVHMWDHNNRTDLTLATAMATRAELNLERGELQLAEGDARRAAGLARTFGIRKRAAGVLSQLARTAKTGDIDKAISLYEESLDLDDDQPEAKTDLRNLLTLTGNSSGAGELVDPGDDETLRRQTQLLLDAAASICTGQGEWALTLLQGLGEQPAAPTIEIDYANLAVHALRYEAYQQLGAMVSSIAGRGRLVSSQDGVLVYAGQAGREDLPAGIDEAVEHISARQELGLSTDYRYLAHSTSGELGLTVFDAQGGRIFKMVRTRWGVAIDDSVRTLANLEVVAAAAPFLGRRLAGVLELRLSRGEKQQQVDALVSELTTGIVSYALVVNSRGALLSHAGFFTPPALDDAPSKRAAAAMSLLSQTTTYNGRSFLEVVVPVEVRGVSRGVLRLGLSVTGDLESLRRLTGS